MLKILCFVFCGHDVEFNLVKIMLVTTLIAWKIESRQSAEPGSDCIQAVCEGTALLGLVALICDACNYAKRTVIIAMNCTRQIHELPIAEHACVCLCIITFTLLNQL